MIWKHLIAPLLFCESALGQSLLTVLEANGFADYAQQLQGDPILDAPGTEFIIYAPKTSDSDQPALYGRQSSRQRSQNSIQAVDQSGPSASVPFRKRDVKTGGSAWGTLLNDPEFVNLGAGRTQFIVEKPSDSGSGFTVFTGLGDKSEVVGKDIPFDKGVIRPIDKQFTLPEDVSSTLPHLGVDRFADLVKKSGLVDELDTKASLTILAPQNSAFNNMTKRTDDDLAQLIKSHVLVDFVAYSPVLRDGLVYTTLGGGKIKVKVQDGTIYLNGSKIVSGDTIVTNGAVHVIDKALDGESQSQSGPTPVPSQVTAAGATQESWSWKVLTCSVVGLVAATRYLLV